MTIDLKIINLKDLASLIYETLKRNKIEAILVGGSCVSIYSENRYQSYDLDFVSYEDLRKIESALKPLGFYRVGRCFEHPDCPFLLDFVNPPVSVGSEAIHQFETMQLGIGELKLLRPTDCIKDRLASFYYWNDSQALEQALLVAERHPIQLSEIENWSIREGFEIKFIKFKDRLKIKKG